MARSTAWYLATAIGVLGGSACSLPEDEPASAVTTATGEVRSAVAADCTWSQWGRSATHDGQSCAVGQDPDRILNRIVYDPFEFRELTESGGVLFVHYPVPLTDDAGDYFMLQKGGSYTLCDSPGSGTPFPCGNDPANVAQQTWSETKYLRRADGQYQTLWTFHSDWKPFPVFLWEPMFQPALAGALLYVPGDGGTVWQVDAASAHGTAIRRINPFATIDPNTYVTSGITVDAAGSVYWNVIRLDPSTGLRHGLLVKSSPTGETQTVDYQALIPGAPAAFDPCFTTFPFVSPPVPKPPSADAVPPSGICGLQRAGVNVTPAIAADGTIITATKADFNRAYSYIVALNPDLSLKWATSLRGLVNDGCGVHRPGFPEGDVKCSATFAAVGVDPNTNQPPALAVDDRSSSSPVILPDGGVVYGALDNYNFARGHLVKLDANGQPAGTYTFGWDTTPAIYTHDGSYSIVMKDNHYNSSGPFNVTQLSKDLVPEWSYQNPSTQACVRRTDGVLVCSDTSPDGETHAGGFEWCVNAPAVDAQGNVFANAEDGFVYQIGQGGVLKSQTFLNQALGAAYTPISFDKGGRIFALNNGEMTVLGQ
jgi:hypothetical protein